MMPGRWIRWCMAFVLLADVAAAQSLKVTKEIEFKARSESFDGLQRWIEEFNRLKAAQDWTGLLKTAREFATTDAKQPTPTRADLRILAIEALAEYARFMPTDR